MFISDVGSNKAFVLGINALIRYAMITVAVYVFVNTNVGCYGHSSGLTSA